MKGPRAAATGTEQSLNPNPNRESPPIEPPPINIARETDATRLPVLTLNRAGLARARPTMACRATWAVGLKTGARPSPGNVPCWPEYFLIVLGRASCH